MQYTLDELVERTGFSKRQIRYYITQKLVPGAGDQRGPNAVYGEETLRRLELIAVYKDLPVGPTGRAMTLAEIRHLLDHPTTEQRAKRPDMVTGSALLSSQRKLESSASDYLNSMDSLDVDAAFRRDQSMDGVASCNIPQIQFDADYLRKTTPTGPLNDLMQGLHSLLTELGSDTRLASQVSEGESWRRITSPDVEIQVRTPDNLEALGRLKRMAAQLGRLLAREE